MQKTSSGYSCSTTVALLFLTLIGCAWGGEESLTREEVAAHLRYLASDELMGRGTGTPGSEKAARYIARQFERNGVKTLPGLDGYFQRIAFRRSVPVSEGSVELLGQRREVGEGLIVIAGSALRSRYQAVFAANGLGGSGYPAVEGKIVITGFGDPEEPNNSRAGLRASRRKLQIASRNGASALLELYSGRGWKRLGSFFTRSRLTLESDSLSGSDSGIAHLLVRDFDRELQTRVERIGSLDLVAEVPAVEFEPVSSSNVMGLVPGSDPELRQEYVLLTAHYDHLGAGAELPFATPEDSIFNGARDNGMGTVALIAAAKALAARPASRSVAFLAVTAEEMGLLGSRYYAQHPAFPINRTVFVLNTDSGGFTDTGLVTVIGLERSTAGLEIRAAAADFGLEAIQDPDPSQNLFDRSDNIHFARLGIPAPTFSGGFRSFDGELMKYYHRPSDEVDALFDFEYLLRFCQAYARSARRIADMPDTPRWVEGDEFEPVWRRLRSSQE